MSLLIVLYVVEISLNRWNQLTDKEKSKLTTLLEFKKNFLAVSDAFVLGIKNFKNFLNFQNFPNYFEKVNKKKWVRNDKNDNIKD